MTPEDARPGEGGGDAMAAIEVLVRENRTFPPPEHFVAQAVISDPSVYEEAERDYAGGAEAAIEGPRHGCSVRPRTPETRILPSAWTAMSIASPCAVRTLPALPKPASRLPSGL